MAGCFARLAGSPGRTSGTGLTGGNYLHTQAPFVRIVNMYIHWLYNLRIIHPERLSAYYIEDRTAEPSEMPCQKFYRCEGKSSVIGILTLHVCLATYLRKRHERFAQFCLCVSEVSVSSHDQILVYNLFAVCDVNYFPSCFCLILVPALTIKARLSFIHLMHGFQ